MTTDSAGRINCTFLNQRDLKKEKSFTVFYGRCTEQLTNNIQAFTRFSLMISIQLDRVSDLQDYCYTTIASNDTFSVLIEGRFSSITSE